MPNPSSLAPDAADRRRMLLATPAPDAGVREGAGRRAHRPAGHTATRIEERAFDLPVAIDSIGAARIQQGQLQINLSESPRVFRAWSCRTVELRAGPTGFLAWLRCTGELRRARDTPLSGRHSGDDARRAGPDGQLQSGLRAAHRGPARPVLDPVRQCCRRRDLDLQRGRAADPDGAGGGRRRQLWHLECDREFGGEETVSTSRWSPITSPPTATATIAKRSAISSMRSSSSRSATAPGSR